MTMRSNKKRAASDPASPRHGSRPGTRRDQSTMLGKRRLTL
jgi:hypothetical protein